MLVTGCNLIGSENEEEPVARVFDNYLYPSDLADAIPNGSGASDSTVIARSYIDTWVRNQLMLHRAEEALSDDQKDVQKKIEEYRSSLLIYTYRQKLLQQKMDTLVTDEEIRAYYEANTDNFILNDVVVKGTFLKVPLSSPEIANVRSWMRSGTADDLDKLEKYSVNYAEKFDLFNNTWVYFNAIMSQVPLEIQQPERFLRYNRNIETSDSQFHYFIHISEYRNAGETSPLDLIREDIRSILLNKRKIQFYNSLENQVYTEGANRNQFEIY
jgi:predicted DNA-binding protein YlxM (UPF0122 family)